MDVSCEEVQRPGVDSYVMDSGGAVFLHELTHWWGIMVHIGDLWTQTFGNKGTEDYARWDWPGTTTPPLVSLISDGGLVAQPSEARMKLRACMLSDVSPSHCRPSPASRFLRTLAK